MTARTTDHLRHIMVDLETLGTGDGAAIVQVGAVRFDPDWGEAGGVSSPAGEFVARVAMDSEFFGTIDGPTVLWWMQQAPMARRRAFQDGPGQQLLDVLRDFSGWIRAQGEVEGIWSDGANFDLRLLRQAYERCGMPKLPWAYRQERCHRTLRALGKAWGIEPPQRVGVDHDALDDAYNQAYHAIEILRASARAKA